MVYSEPLPRIPLLLYPWKYLTTMRSCPKASRMFEFGRITCITENVGSVKEKSSYGVV